MTPRSSDKLSVKDVSEVCHGVATAAWCVSTCRRTNLCGSSLTTIVTARSRRSAWPASVAPTVARSMTAVALSAGWLCSMVKRPQTEKALFRTYSPTPGGCGNVLVALGLANNLYVSEEGSARVSSGVSGYSERLLPKSLECLCGVKMGEREGRDAEKGPQDGHLAPDRKRLSWCPGWKCATWAGMCVAYDEQIATPHRKKKKEDLRHVPKTFATINVRKPSFDGSCDAAR